MNTLYFDRNQNSNTFSQKAFLVGLNHQIVGKCEPQKLSYAGAFTPTQVSILELADHIGKGHPWMPGVLDAGAKRWQQHANYAEVLGADIDGGMTIAGGLENPLIKNHCSLLIESASSKPELEKFRLVFVLPRAAEGYQLIKVLNRYLIDLLGVADKACKDASRFFFGAPGRSPKLLQSVTLPESFIEDAIAWDKEIELEADRKYQAALSRRTDNPTDPNDLRDLAESALRFIPPRIKGQNTYDDCITCLFALYSEFGDGAIAIAERWSPSHGEWDIAKKVQSFGRGSTGRSIGLGSLFYLARQNGWNFPKREFSPRDYDRYQKQDTQVGAIADSRELGGLGVRVNNSRKSKWLRRATGFVATHEFDKQFIDLPDIQSGVAAEDWLISIKSGLGTGKTQLLNPLIESLESSGKGRGVAMLGYRNSLLLQTAKRIGAYHLHHHSAFDLIKDADSRIVACLDSLEHFPDDYFDGKILILDELTSIVKHLLSSSTCAKNRTKILEKFIQAIKRSAIVVSLDGNMADWVVDYLQTLRSESKGVAKLLNTYNLQNTPLEILPSFGQSGLVSKIIEVLPGYKSQNQSIAIATDSQRLGEKLDLMFTEKGYRVYRIDSKTITQKEVKKYIESPDRNLDILIYTPSCESGLDIPLEGFAHTFAFFLGVVDTATQIQMLRRVRKVDRITVQCVPYSRLNRMRSPILEEFQQELENALLLDGSEQLDHVKFWLEKQKESLHYPVLCELLQNRDFERTNTLDCLVELARSHGYSPEIVDIADCKATGLELSKASQQVKEGEAIAIFKAQDLTVSQAIAIKASFTASLDDRYALQKFEIKDTLPGIENTEFWNVEGIIEIRNMWRSIPNLKLLWHSRNLEKSKLLSDKRWQGWIEQDRFIGDCLSNPYAKAKMINALGILNLPDNFSADSPEIQAIDKAGIDKRRGLRSVLGVVKGSLESMQWVKNLLGLVGLQAGVSGRKFGQSRTYQIVDFSPLYKTVLSCISKGLESQYAQALESCQLTENIVPNPPPVGMGLENIPNPTEEPKIAPPEPPKYIPEMVTFIQGGVTLTGELLGQQGEFIRVRVNGQNYLANTENLVA